MRYVLISFISYSVMGKILMDVKMSLLVATIYQAEFTLS